MTTFRKVLQGSLVDDNAVVRARNPVVSISGQSASNRATLELNEDILSKHIMLIGGTGCGKSNTFYHIVSQLKRKMCTEDVMIIFDTKGDYYSKFYSPHDLVIGNSAQYETQSECWNLYREILADGWDENAIELNAQELSWTIFREAIDKSKDPFFPNAARDVFYSLIISIMEKGKSDVAYKKKFFYNDELKKVFDFATINNISNALNKSKTGGAAASYLGDGTSNQALGIYAELLSSVRKVITGVFARKGSFSIRNFVRKRGGRTLFIEYDMAIGNSLGPLYSLLFDLAIKEVLAQKEHRGNVYLICDEFKLLPHLQHIENAVNFGRSMGLKVIAGLQSVDQLTEVYGEYRGRNILAGFSTVIAFRANDVHTRKYITELHGENVTIEQFVSLNNSFSEERHMGHVVEDWDMVNLKVGEAIVGLPFAKPFKFYFDIYGGF